MREDCCGRIPHDNRCPYADEPLIIGVCKNCKKQLTSDYECWTDNEGNKFCSKECADNEHGIRECCF